MTPLKKDKSLICHNFSKEGAIGIFDSGIGGLTVLQEIHRLLPYEDLIYLGDTARVPYGNKSAEAVKRYALENGTFLIEKGVKALVIACNTASAHAGKILEESLSIPVIGVIEPGVEAATKATLNGQIAVLATKGTLQSGIYQQLIKQCRPNTSVITIACPLFVPLVEEGMAGHSLSRMTAEYYLSPLKNSSVDTILLGCTHYPLLREVIQDVMGPDVTVIDSASTCAKKLALKLYVTSNRVDHTGTCEYFVSDDPKGFQSAAEELLEIPKGPVTRFSSELVSSPISF